MLSPRNYSIFILISAFAFVQSWAPITSRILSSHDFRLYSEQSRSALHLFETKEKKADAEKAPAAEKSVEETTEAYGLEAGLFQSLKQNDGGKSAKDLLAKYGVAYLATSIPLAIVSFAICYVLVDSGVDVSGLLGKIGIEVTESGEKVGTFAIAYAAHKAASPIRFPPTVLLTPVVAKLIGKEPNEENAEEGAT